MPSLRVAALLALRRARNRPTRWFLIALGIAAATAYGGVVLAESTLAADRAARAVLQALPPVDRVVRVSWTGVVTPTVEHEARALLGGLGLGGETEVVLLNPVRLGSTLVRPAAISPLPRWSAGAPPARCGARRCPMLALGTGNGLAGRTLATSGLSVPVIGAARLNSAAPLGYRPGDGSAAGGEVPVLVTGDPGGLESLPSLSGVYRSHSWFSSLSPGTLHAWDLAALQRRWQRTQAAVALSGTQFSLSAPFAGLEAARSRADDAPAQLLLTGGGALAAFALFLILAGDTLRRDQREELERLRGAGALPSTLLAFSVTEAALVAGIGVPAGGGLAIGVTAMLTSGSGIPLGGVLDHSVLSTAGVLGLTSAWLVATAGLGLLLALARPGIADALALAALAALVLALTGSGGDARTLLLAPLACLAAGVILARGGGLLLRLGERAGRRTSPLSRLALVQLARSPGAPSLAIAFLAVSTGLGGFALAYRATLLRGAADGAADLVPLDAVVAAGADFRTPLEIAPLSRWRSLAGGAAFAVRRTDATYAGGAASVTVPGLGVPAAALPRLQGWRKRDAPRSLRELARRLRPPGPAPNLGPALARTARTLAVRVAAPALTLTLVADLRAGDGSLRRLPLATGKGNRVDHRAVLPPGGWSLEAFELREPTGLEITAGHQNGENPAAATQATVPVTLGRPELLDARGRLLGRIPVAGWRGVGSVSALRPGSGGVVIARFSTTGAVGVLRPPQPIDQRALPVLVDPGTAAASTAGRIALTVDGAPIPARIVAVLKRFPTVPAGAGGFVVADERELASALDAWLPGQGRPDELWLSASDPARLAARLRNSPYADLTSTLRAQVQQSRENGAVPRAEQTLLLGAAAVLALLALAGVLVSLLGSAEQERVTEDLAGQGVSPRALRRELRLRSLLAGIMGTLLGLAIALMLTRLAVGAVRAAGGAGPGQLPLVTVLPWSQLALWCAALIVAAPLVTMLGAEGLGRRRGPG